VSRQPATTGETQAVTTANDEDDIFRRNRGRTAQQWKELSQSAAKATPFTISDDDWDVHDERENTSTSKPHKKKRPIKPNDRPRWQSTNVATMLSSDNEDDNFDIQIIEQTSRKTTGNTSPNKRKRERSNSRSITPPPKLSDHQRANAMNIVRQALAFQRQPRSPSPTLVLDDSSDTIDLDPELAKIAEAVKQQVKHAYVNQERIGGPETVAVKVRWRPHPRNPLGQEQCWTFNVRRHETFRELFDGVADLAGVMANQLVISHDHRRVFASGTPHSLHLWAEGEMEACDKRTDEYIRAQQRNRQSSPSRDDSSPGCSPSTVPQSDSDVEPESESAGDTIKLVFRSAATKDKTFPLTVRSTTTCGAIVKAFLKAAGLPDKYSRAASTRGSAPFPQLMVDGDKMASTAEIGDADLEDGDLVEIVGL
jgi:hypothetical protein